jgi:hypothetical protein
MVNNNRNNLLNLLCITCIIVTHAPMTLFHYILYNQNSHSLEKSKRHLNRNISSVEEIDVVLGNFHFEHENSTQNCCQEIRIRRGKVPIYDNRFNYDSIRRQHSYFQSAEKLRLLLYQQNILEKSLELRLKSSKPQTQ